MKVCVLAGGVGAARFLRGLLAARDAVDPRDVTAIVNVADDVELHGLWVSPDLDTVTYTLAGAINPETGWGLAGESWQAMTMVERYQGLSWFRLGDRDLGTHLYRTHRRGQGASLSEVTAEITAAWELPLRVMPVTDDRLETRVTLAESGEEIGFQEYFVQRQHSVAVSSVRFAGAESCHPAPGALDSMSGADAIVIAPSNPIVSIGPLLAVPGVREELVACRDHVVAISPIVAGAAIKGPADRLMTELGHEASVAGVARIYRDVAATLVIDTADAASRLEVEAEGVQCVVTDTIMADPSVARTLALTTLEAARGGTR